MVQTTSAEFVNADGERCRTSLGAYHLPKSMLSVSVTADPANRRIIFNEDDFKLRSVADGKTYCLDFLSSVTGEDRIWVQRTHDLLLTQVTSDATDRTPEIAAKLIDAGANVAILTRATGDAAAAKKPVKIEFDPFDRDDSASANEALRPYGYCVVVDETLGGENSERWCGLQRKPRLPDPLYEAAQAPPPLDAARQEILYRPNQSYNVSVLRKRDPNGGGRWETYLTRRMEMPNRSPIFGVGVRRALFTHRATSLIFSNGVLDDVKIDKGSEALGFASIPLYLAQTVVQIPTRIVQLQIDTANQRANLIDAQGQLINAWATYNKTLAATPGSDGATRALRVNDASMMEKSCLDAKGPLAYCGALARAARP